MRNLAKIGWDIEINYFLRWRILTSMLTTPF